MNFHAMCSHGLLNMVQASIPSLFGAGVVRDKYFRLETLSCPFSSNSQAPQD